MNINFPFHFDGRGHTATTDYIRDMIEQGLMLDLHWSWDFEIHGLSFDV